MANTTSTPHKTPPPAEEPSAVPKKETLRGRGRHSRFIRTPLYRRLNSAPKTAWPHLVGYFEEGKHFRLLTHCTSSMKVYLDDARPPPPGWTLVRWPEEVIALLKTGKVTHLSLDHDLGDAPAALREGRREITGDDVLIWLQEQVRFHGFTPPAEILVHSSNGSGVPKMRLGIQRLYEILNERS